LAELAIEKKLLPKRSGRCRQLRAMAPREVQCYWQQESVPRRMSCSATSHRPKKKQVAALLASMLEELVMQAKTAQICLTAG